MSFAVPVSAKQLVVAADGTGDYKTIDKALKKAQLGDEVVLADRGRIGAALKKDGKTYLIEDVVPDSAADVAGLKQGDRIVMVETENVEHLSLADLIDRLKGRPTSTVTLRVLKAGQDTAKAVDLVRKPTFVKLAKERDAFDAARFYGADEETIADLAEPLADAGYADAQAHMAWAYLNGKGVSKNVKKSAKFAEPSAKSGNPWGQRLWGHLLFHGLGAPMDKKQGVIWFVRSADQGDLESLYAAGWHLMEGNSIAADVPRGEAFVKKAVEQGHAAAKVYWDGVLKKRGEAASKQPAPAPQDRLSREDVKAMMAEALREQKPAPEPAKPAAPAAVAPTYQRPERPADLAVVIGVEKYASLPEASFAERDAEAVRAHLKALGFADRNVFMLTGPRATRSAFVKELETRLTRLVEPQSNVFVYFSGHGAPDPKSGEAYLVPYDGDPEFLEETAYPLKKLYEKLGALKAKSVIVALDSCFSGSGGRSVLAKGTRPLVAKVEQAPAGGVSVLTAASGTEISGSLDEQKHGLFTYHLLNGLNGGNFSLSALRDYVRPKVADAARRSNRDQTPQLLGAQEASLAP